jgi:hypothetical protein
MMLNLKAFRQLNHLSMDLHDWHVHKSGFAIVLQNIPSFNDLMAILISMHFDVNYLSFVVLWTLLKVNVHDTTPRSCRKDWTRVDLHLWKIWNNVGMWRCWCCYQYISTKIIFVVKLYHSLNKHIKVHCLLDCFHVISFNWRRIDSRLV